MVLSVLTDRLRDSQNLIETFRTFKCSFQKIPGTIGLHITLVDINHVEPNHLPARQLRAVYARPVARPCGDRVCDSPQRLRGRRGTSGATGVRGPLTRLQTRTCAREVGAGSIACGPARAHKGPVALRREVESPHLSEHRMRRRIERSSQGESTRYSKDDGGENVDGVRRQAIGELVPRIDDAVRLNAPDDALSYRPADRCARHHPDRDRRFYLARLI